MIFPPDPAGRVKEVVISPNNCGDYPFVEFKCDFGHGAIHNIYECVVGVPIVVRLGRTPDQNVVYGYYAHIKIFAYDAGHQIWEAL